MNLTPLIFLLVLLFAAPAFGQALNGTVADERGQTVSGAELSLMREGTVIARTRSDELGRFSFALADESDATLRASAPGFADLELRVRDLGSPAVVILKPRGLEENVTVSITRTDSRIDETPASVIVFNRDKLDSTAAPAIDDALRQIAGFTLFRRSSSRTSNPTTQGANLRGIGGSGAARTAVLFDGVSLNDAFGGWTFWTRVPDIAVERVEVLRGGASSLYGSSAVSGAIELSPSRDRREALRFEGSGGSQRTLDGSLFGALSHGEWYADVAAESFQTRGYIPVAREQQGIVDTRANSRHTSGLVTIERRFGENRRVFARGNLLSERRDNGTSLTNNRTHFRQLVGGGDVTSARFGAFQFRGAIDSQVYDQTFSAVSADRNSENLTRIQRVPSRSNWASALWSRAFGDHALNVQTEVRYVRGFSQEIAVAGNVANAAITSGGKEFTVGFSVQDFWRATPRLHISAGVRFDRWREFGGLSRTKSLVTAQISETVFAERSEQSFSPRFAAIYRLTDSISLFGSFARSFRAPSLNELYRSFRVGNVLTLANEDLRAERASTLEGGVSVTAFSNWTTLRANVFQTNVTDPVVSVTLSTTPALITRRRDNVGETRARGLEVDAEARLSERLRLTFGYLFVDSRVVDAGGNAALVGKRLPQVARQHFTSQAIYRPLRSFTFSVQARASDAQFDDDLNTFRLRPFFTLDAYSAYRFSKWVEIFAAAENVFDNRYDIGLTPVRTIAAPRSFRAGLRFDLDRKD